MHRGKSGFQGWFKIGGEHWGDFLANALFPCLLNFEEVINLEYNLKSLCFIILLYC